MRLFDEVANNNGDSVKYSNFMMEGGDADPQQTTGQALSSGREQIFDYVTAEKRTDSNEREPEGREELEQPMRQESSALAKMATGGDDEFRPFAGLDDLEPIEKKSQYSDDNEDDAIADERETTQEVADEEGAQMERDQCGVSAQL